MTDKDWDAGTPARSGVFLNGKAIPGHDERGRPITDDSFLLLFNAHSRDVYWTLPKQYGGPWRLLSTPSGCSPNQKRERSAMWCGRRVDPCWSCSGSDLLDLRSNASVAIASGS